MLTLKRNISGNSILPTKGHSDLGKRKKNLMLKVVFRKKKVLRNWRMNTMVMWVVKVVKGQSTTNTILKSEKLRAFLLRSETR